MPTDLPLACRCGRVHGVLREFSAADGFRFICYCKDCQAFARFLDRADVLDRCGGTDIVQLAPGRLQFLAGSEALRSLRFSGKVLRWYSGCCQTPIANTAFSARVPLIGLIHSFVGVEHVDRSRQKILDESLDEVLGPPLCRIYERSAIAALPANAPAPASLKLFALRAGKAFGWWWRGLGRPNPFFDEQTGAPRALPRFVTPAERAVFERATA